MDHNWLMVSGLWVNGSDHYTFTGIGFTVTTNDPDLYLARGNVYEFVNNMDLIHSEFRAYRMVPLELNTTLELPIMMLMMEQHLDLKFHSVLLTLFTISVLHTLEWVEPSSSIQLLDNYSK